MTAPARRISSVIKAVAAAGFRPIVTIYPDGTARIESEPVEKSDLDGTDARNAKIIDLMAQERRRGRGSG